MQTDNSTAEAIINSRVQPKHTKAMDMWYHWLQDRGINQKQFRIFWRLGPLNYVDYWNPMQTDNSTAEAIINSRVQPKRTKAMDMCYHWLRDRGINQKQFRIFWRLRLLNYADCWTQHPPRPSSKHETWIPHTH
jgi:hypothetical protein